MKSVYCLGAVIALLFSADPSIAQQGVRDSVEKSSSGATFTLPNGWSAVRRGSAVILSPSETDSHVAIVDVGPAANASEAADAAWKLYSKPQAHTAKSVINRAPRNGWEERASIEYDTSADEMLDVSADAFRGKAGWTVLLTDINRAVADKRGAALNLINRTLRPAGYVRESFADRQANTLTPSRVDELRSFVEMAAGKLGVPGVGFALIDHGKVVFDGGVGVLRLGQPAKVDAHTSFMIASNTKGMSTLLLARLVDAGRLAWNEPVTTAYPSFRLGDAETTKKVLVRHLVCACTGLPRKDYEWILGANLRTPPSSTFEQLAATKPTSGFGEVFQYNNLMASAAGYIAGHLLYPKLELGAAYDRAMQAQIFDPLDMRETTFDFPAAMAKPNHASPHFVDVDFKPAIADIGFDFSIVPYRPAGGAWSTANDMIKYVQLELGEGKLPNGRQLVSKENLMQRRVPNVTIGEDAYYGMGLETDASWGVTVVHHGGTLSGYTSDIMAIPAAEVGAVILTNSDEGQLMLRPFMRKLLEVLYDGKPEAAGDVAAAADRLRAQFAAERARLTIPPPADMASNLAARYKNAELGTIKVTQRSGAVRFDFASWGSDMGARKNDDGTTSFAVLAPAGLGIEFISRLTDGKRSLILRDGQHEYVFAEAG